MGLDMYLYRVEYLGMLNREQAAINKLSNLVYIPPVDLTGGNSNVKILVNIGYWRKANAIHSWFVRELAAGVDECQTIVVSDDDLKKLREVCQQVLDRPNLASMLLPTQSGFFFGGTEYDEWYFNILKHTIEIIDDALSHEGDWFEYKTSW